MAKKFLIFKFKIFYKLLQSAMDMILLLLILHALSDSKQTSGNTCKVLVKF